MISHDEMLDNVAVYALGALPAAEAAEVAAHLKTCDSCRAEYELLRPAVTAVGSSAADYHDKLCPGPMLKARIMREVRGSQRSNAKAYRWETFAAIAAAFVLTVGALLLYTTMDRHIVRQTALVAAQSAALADLAAADAKRYPFGNGQVFVRGSHLYVTLPRLAEPPAGKVYQAWTLPKGSKTMAPSITFTPNERDVTVVRLPESALDVAAVAVSVEPAGGSKQPTSKPIALATL
ncbi:MAG TPA: anti-sigma factor [Candidatus Cybelea sp.]|jgi:anti-sigma-K factor RskA